jgi:hypothetical protein
MKLRGLLNSVEVEHWREGVKGYEYLFPPN